MPEKNIDFWAQLWRWIQINIPFLSGITLAALIGFIREKREGNSGLQSFSEAVMCGLISVGAIRALEWLLLYTEFPKSWSSLAEFCGAMIGFFGTKKLSSSFDSILGFVRNKFGVNR
nr:phage holin family protein [uncultured Moellerella sp.]